MSNDNNTTILYISYDGMTDQLGQSQVLPYLIELTKKDSFRFVLLSCEKKENFNKNKTVIENMIKDYPIDWQPLIYHKSPPIISVLYDLWNIQRRAKLLHSKFNFKLIHCRSYISSLIGLSLKRKYKIPFVFDMRGFWADERIDGNLWKLSNPLYNIIYKYFKSKEKEFLIESDALISLTKAGVEEIKKWNLPIDIASKTTVIPCCADFNLYQKTSKEEILKTKQQLNIEEDAFILLYLGAIGTWYMTDEMMLFFKELLTKQPNAIFLILTSEKEEAVVEIALKHGISKQHIRVAFAPKKQVAKISSVADWSIFFIKPAFSKIASSPTKLGELLSLQIPVICNSFRVGDIEQIILETKGGIVINNFDALSYKKSIENMDSFKKIYDPNTVRTEAKKYYDLDIGAERYLLVYRKILNKLP